MSKWLQFVSMYWRTFVVILAPLVFLALPLSHHGSQDYCVLWLLLVMATFWVTEALPLVITSVLPIVFLPLMGIMSTNDVTQMYWKETTTMLLASVIIAIAIEHSQLHQRIALITMLTIGCSQRRISFSLMFVTTFLSMWISNVAACAMMLPIGRAVLQEVENNRLCRIYKDKTEDDDPEATPEPTNIANAIFIGIMYASTIGGCCTVIGTGTNLVLQGMIPEHFPNAPDLNFAKFMLYSTPVMYVFMVITWLWIQVMHMGMFRPNSAEYKEGDLGQEGNRVLTESVRAKYAELGRMSSHEAWVLCLFVLAIGLWFFRQPGFMPGWTVLFSDKIKISDSTVSFLIVAIMFIIPKKWTWLNWLTCNSEQIPKKNSPALLTWKMLNDQIPWSLMFLVGAGFAMSKAGKTTRMSVLIADWMGGLKILPKELILMLVVLMCQIMTEFASNVAVANIVLPILAVLSVSMKVNPLYLMLPATLGCSMALNTQVGTPPNAVACQTVYLRPNTLVKTGWFLSLVIWILLCLSFPTFGALIFDGVNEFPEWAKK